MIDYEELLFGVSAADRDALIAHLRARLPRLWLEEYKRMCSGPTNVLEMSVSGFDYLFDFSSELVMSGETTEDLVQDDRLVAAHGVSRAAEAKRAKSRIRGFPSGQEREDRGHFVAHTAGGGLDINLFHQAAALNRGWSAAGKRYRAMERYCASHAGTFFFNRPIYSDKTARPSAIEFGILKSDGTMWVEQFANRSEGSDD